MEVPRKIISLDDYRMEAGTKAAPIAGEQLEISITYPSQARNKEILLKVFDAFMGYVRGEMEAEIEESR